MKINVGLILYDIFIAVSKGISIAAAIVIFIETFSGTFIAASNDTFMATSHDIFTAAYIGGTEACETAGYGYEKIMY